MEERHGHHLDAVHVGDGLMRSLVDGVDGRLRVRVKVRARVRARAKTLTLTLTLTLTQP